MKKNNTIYIKDSFDTYPIPIQSKDGVVNFTVYLTEDQLQLLKAKGLFRISYRKIERLKESSKDSPSYYIFPTIEYIPEEGGSRKRQHLGNFLYPDIQSTWNNSIWKERIWDFRRSNLNLGPDNTIKCETCDKWADKFSLHCNTCSYFNYVLSVNKVELNKVGLVHSLSDKKLKSLHSTTNCEISGIPMLFKPNSGLKALSIDRIEKMDDLSDKNILLVLSGITHLRSTSSYPVLLDFLNKTDSCKGVEVEINTALLNKLKELIRGTKYRFLQKTQEKEVKVWSITLDEICEILEETKGICKITNVPLDLQFTNPRSIFNPSICRIDLNKGFIKGNVQIVSLGANRLLSLGYTNEECITFYKEVIEGYRKKNKIRVN